MREVFEVEVVTLGEDQAAAPSTWPDEVNARHWEHERRLVEMETQFAWLEDLYKQLRRQVSYLERVLLPSKGKEPERIEP